MASYNNQYDVLIVGAGIAGCAMARALSQQNTRTHILRIGVLERSLAEPVRIVGELLQPGGMVALAQLGMQDCVDGIDAVTCTGYCVIDASAGRKVHIPYPGTHTGRSFHHGRFIQKLRSCARSSRGVELVEGTVTDLLESPLSRRVVGVKATTSRTEKRSESFYAKIVIVADGFASNFRSRILGMENKELSTTKSHFVGAILKDATLPIPGCGTVCLVPGSGPVLMYQIDEPARETRILVDVREPLPKDLPAHIICNILPHLPLGVQQPLREALSAGGLKRMPNSFMPPRPQPQHKEGVILLGDAWNMRHPLTGGGMTVAFTDVVLLSRLLEDVQDLSDWDHVQKALHSFFWRRKPLASTVNVLSVALYDLFGAESEDLAVLRTGCFKYFELGGECVNGPVSLLGVTNPSFSTLFYHFFSVALYSIWVLFTHEVYVDGEKHPRRPSVLEWPELFLRSVMVFWTACVVFLPIMWTEMRWW